jgi:hypothetical protein
MFVAIMREIKRARIDGTTNKVGKLAKMPHPPMPIHG